MKKYIIIGFLVLAISFGAKAQCPQTNCQDSLASNVTSDPLSVVSGFTNVQWQKLAGPGTINPAGTLISGLIPGSTTVLMLQCQQGNSMVISIKTITVAPIPVVIPPPRTVTSFTYNPITKALAITFSDGGTQN